MGINKIRILSTKLIDESLISIAAMYNLLIDPVAFIETQDITTPCLQKRITELSQQNITVIFTSANAVEAVNKLLPAKPSWKIFCMNYKTKESVENIFGNENIIGTASNAAQLAEKVINASSAKKIIFFSGDKRRDELPQKLKMNGFELEELILYKTIEKPQAIAGIYDGLLFFSPSGVKSFFAANTINERTKIFAIGNTTAEEIRSFTHLPVIIAEFPDTKNLISEVIKHFSTVKSF